MPIIYKYSLFLLAGIILNTLSFGQKNIDSLKQVIWEDTSPKNKLTPMGDLILYYTDNDLDSALLLCDQYNQIATQLNDQNEIAKSYFFYTSVYSAYGEYQQLSNYAYPALDHFKNMGNKQGQIDILVILGRMNGAKREFEKAYNNYEEAIQLAEESNNYAAMVMTNVGISNTKFLEEKLEEAELYLKKSIAIVKEYPLKDSSEYLAKIYTNLGNINSAKTNDVEAIKFYKKSHQYYWRNNDKFGISLTAFNIGDVYNYNDMYDSALKYFNITLQMGNELQNFEELYYAHLGFTEVYERKGDFEKAYEYQKIKHAYADSLLLKKYDESVVELEKKYNSEKKAAELKATEKEVRLAEEQKEKDENTIKLLAIGGGILALLVIALIFMYQRVSNARNLILNQSESLDKALKQKEILLQEVHHRVKNNLQLIASLLNLQSASIENENAKNAIEESKSRVQAIALMHKGLYQDDNYSSVELKTYVQELVENQKTMSASSEFDISFNVTVEKIELDIDKSVPIGLIISELISNSLKHAFADRYKGNISIKITHSSSGFMLDYSDDGCGLPDDFKIEGQDSLGYTIITALTEQIGGTLTIESHTPFKVSLRF